MCFSRSKSADDTLAAGNPLVSFASCSRWRQTTDMIHLLIVSFLGIDLSEPEEKEKGEKIIFRSS